MKPLTRAVIRKAAAELDALAEDIRYSHTIPGGPWGDHPADQSGRKEYERLKKLVWQLRRAA